MKNNLNDTQLEEVSGGNAGDYQQESSDTKDGVRYLYNLNQAVTFYPDAMHVRTAQGEIKDRKAEEYTDFFGTHYKGLYYIKYRDPNTYQTKHIWVDADAIVSNS